MFVQGGRLQIIFGDVQQSGDADPGNTSHHVDPHRAGKRKERIDKELVIAEGPGISYFSGDDFERSDWILIDVPATVAAWRGPAILPGATATPVAAPGLPPAPQTVTPTGMAPVAPPGAATAPPITAEQQRQLEERRQMAEEMARLRKQVQEQGGGAAAQPSTGTAAAKPAGKSIEERLAMLQALHEKKLITDEEYAAKRKALLEEL
jgi:hypothetical protein